MLLKSIYYSTIFFYVSVVLQMPIENYLADRPSDTLHQSYKANNTGASCDDQEGGFSESFYFQDAKKANKRATNEDCEQNANITILESGTSINANDQYICNTNTATLNAGLGFDSYLWNTGANTQTIVVNTSGIYSVTVTYNGCMSSDSQAIFVHSLPLMLNVTENSGSFPNDNKICVGDTVSLEVLGGGAGYSWNTGQTTSSIKATPPINTLFRVTVTGNACSYTVTSQTVFPTPIQLSANVTVGNKPNITVMESGTSINSTDQYICSTNTATLNAGSGFDSYLWSTGANTQTIVVNTSDRYSVTVTKDGCMSSDTQAIIVHTLPLMLNVTENSGLFPNDNTICIGDTVNLEVLGGGTGYSWNTGQTTSSIKATPLVNTLFGVTVTGNACSYTVSSMTIVPTPIQLSANVNVGAKPNISVMESGTSINAGDQYICSNNTATLNAGAGLDSYLWNTGANTQSIIVNSSGDYSVTVTKDGCVAADTQQIIFHSLPVLVNVFENSGIAPNDNNICMGDTICLLATGGGTAYSWNTGQTDSTFKVPLAANSMFTVTVTGNACSFDVSSMTIVPKAVTASANITVGTMKTTITITEGGTNLNAGDEYVCNSNGATLDAGPGFDSYLWNTGATTQTIQVNTSGDYSVIVSKDGCFSVDTQEVIVHSLPVLVEIEENSGIAANDNVICLGDTVCVTATGGGTNYLWSAGGNPLPVPSSDSTFKSVPAQNTQFAVIVTGNACSFAVSSTIQPLPVVATANVEVISLQVDAGQNQTVCADSTMIQLNGSVSGSSTEGMWNGGSGTFLPNNTTLNAIYQLGASDISAGFVDLVLSSQGMGDGCGSKSDTMRIFILPIPDVDQPSSQEVCSGEMTEQVNFTSSENNVFFSWTNDNPAIGLGTNGLGNIPPFMALNNGSSPEIANIIVSSYYSGTVSNQSPPNGWTDLMQIDIAENSGSPLMDYQLRLEINTLELISAGKLQSSGADLRFGYNNGANLLNYWIESGLNTVNTVVWVKIDQLPANAITSIYMYYGNPIASPQSAIDGTFFGPHSATDSVNTGGAGGVSNSQRGFRFAPNEDILINRFGKRTPNGTARYVTLFDYVSQAILRQDVVPGPAAEYYYDTITEPIWLTSGTQYLLEIFQGEGDGYYFGSSTQIGEHLTYYDMRYCNSCTQNSFPTSSLSNYQYGYPDFHYYTKNNVSNPPTYLISGKVGCDSKPKTFTITVYPSNIVDIVSNDTTICGSTDSIPLSAIYLGQSEPPQWTSTGSGIFSPSDTSLNANYILGETDRTANSIKIFLTSSLCANAIDSMTVYIDSAAIVNAGPDQTVCASDTIYLSATLSGLATNVVWQKNVAFGTFIGPDTEPNAKFVLNSNGMAQSSIKFGIMSNDPVGNVCQGGLDTVEIFISPKAIADAGPDRAVCGSQDTVQLSGMIGGLATSASWSGGSGTFSPGANVLNPVYALTAADTAAGYVDLILTTDDPLGLCGPATDTIRIHIDKPSIVDAGPDQFICTTDTIYLHAELSGLANALVWQKNEAFGEFIGSDTESDAVFVLNANGMAQSSISFGVMSSDPPGVCDGGTDTVVIFITQQGEGKYFVDSSAVGGLNDGSSWENAFLTLQDALDQCDADTICVAKGTYYPDQGGGNTEDDRSAFFELKGGLTLLGGFPTGGNGPREPSCNPTILSGDINMDGDSTGNTYNVIKSIGYDDTIYFDGFIVEHGNAIPNGEEGGAWWDGSFSDNALLDIRNTTFKNNYATLGGAFYGEGSRNLNIIHSIFHDNTSITRGGAMYLTPDNGGGIAEVLLENDLFYNNNAPVNGGAIAVTSTIGINLNVVNSTITKNSPDGINYNSAGLVNILNTIIWENGPASITGMNPPNVQNSIIEFGGGMGVNNKDEDPQFQDPGQNDFRVSSGSPAIDMGDNGFVGTTEDLDGLPRITNGTVDIGAYEFLLNCDTVVLYVNADGSVPGVPVDSFLMSALDSNCMLIVNGEVVTEMATFSCDDTSANVSVQIVKTFCDTADTIYSCIKPVIVLDTFPKQLSGIDALNLSLDEMCMGVVTADMVLSGIQGCRNAFEITLEYPEGTNVYEPANKVDQSHVGHCITFKATLLADGNSTWGTICIEDKLGPTITMLPDTMIFCVESILPRRIGTATATDCGGVEYLDYRDHIEDYMCSPENDIAQIITRVWTAIDGMGNIATDTQIITVKYLPDSLLHAPEPLVTLSCGDDTSPAGIAAKLGDQYGYAYYIDPVNQIISPIKDGVVCNFAVSYEDGKKIEVCEEGCTSSYKMIRTWTLGNWCTGEITRMMQIIKVVDTIAPIIRVESPDKVYSVDAWSCETDIVLPIATVIDNCDEHAGVVKIDGPAGTIVRYVNGRWIAEGVTKGTHELVYTAKDCCGNLSTASITVTVVDKVAPVATAKEYIVVSLTRTGQVGNDGRPSVDDGIAKIYPEMIDNGSYDNCTDVKLEVRREAGSPICLNEGTGGYNNNVTYDNTGHKDDNAKDTDGGAYVKFCCEDVGKEHKVWLRVWDDADMDGFYGSAGDNYNETWATVKVEDNSVPKLVVERDITILCDEDTSKLHLNLSDTYISVNGRVPAEWLPWVDATCDYEISYKDRGSLTTCNTGSFIRTYRVLGGKDGKVAATAEQTI
ncbi:MAG: DUF2341 domain-containing protein, partial [Saprospiraceae bacterium]|nr:DUF2341 domain-containing protein [Saprospiraceae bacterium]